MRRNTNQFYKEIGCNARYGCEVIEFRNGFDPYGQPFTRFIPQCTCGADQSILRRLSEGEAMVLLQTMFTERHIFPDTRALPSIHEVELKEKVLQEEQEQWEEWLAVWEEHEIQFQKKELGRVAEDERPAVLEILEAQLLGHRIFSASHCSNRLSRGR